MPFIAVDPVDNRPRIPVGVSDDEEVQCPVCEDSLRVRDGPSIARHFYHPPDSSCSGESSLHLRMKSIAVDKLQTAYPDATVHVEFVTDEVPRRADVFVEFSRACSPLGKGIAVEVQYRNEQKDFTETTASYLAGGASVIWLFEENYAGTHPEYDDVELPEPVPVWPYGIPHGETRSPESEAEYLGTTEADLISSLPNHVDGQVSLAEFPQAPKATEDSADLPEWSREKELHLNLSVGCLGLRRVYHSWIEGRIQNETSEHRDSVEDRRGVVEAENRATYFSNRFVGEKGARFEISIRVHPSRESQLIIREFVGGKDREIRAQIQDDAGATFTEFVKQLCYELERVRASESKPTVLEQPAQSELYVFSYTLSPTQDTGITAELRYRSSTVELQFGQQHVPKLLELCAKIRLWYDSSDTVS